MKDYVKQRPNKPKALQRLSLEVCPGMQKGLDAHAGFAAVS